MQIWCAFELKLSSAYISYFLQILLQLPLSLSFHLSFIYYFNFKQESLLGILTGHSDPPHP